MYSNNEHYSYLEVTRHWSPISEKYAGGDALVTALACSWRVDGPVFQEDFWHSGARLVSVFHIELSNGDESMVMPVVTNPYVLRMLKMVKATVLPIEKRDASRHRERRD